MVPAHSGGHRADHEFYRTCGSWCRTDRGDRDCGAAVGIAGTLAPLGPRDAEQPRPQPVVLASAPLARLDAADPGVTPGCSRGGQPHLHVVNLPDVPGYYEVWLVNPDTMRMFSVGTLGDSSGALLPLPPKVDLQAYSVVDVSAEQFDNAHSGDSLLRGTLTG